jgi:Fur family ferric uptake transcriptional regulator
LQKNVFAKPAFVEWATKNVVLLELDFPKRTQLPAKLKEQNHPVDATTVYRILERLKECRLIHTLHEGRFVKCSDITNKKAHHFLRCRKCNGVEEIFLDYQKSIASQLATEKNFLLTDIDLEFWGTCSGCIKK